MSKPEAVLDGNAVVRRDHLRRLAAGPEAIAHLLPADDGRAAARRALTDEVAAIGRDNRDIASRTATGAATRRQAGRKAHGAGSGKS